MRLSSMARRRLHLVMTVLQSSYLNQIHTQLSIFHLLYQPLIGLLDVLPPLAP